MSVSSSVSVALTALPILTPELVFSATVSVVLSPSLNTGTLLDSGSSTSVTLMVTVMLSVRVPSETMIVAV